MLTQNQQSSFSSYNIRNYIYGYQNNSNIYNNYNKGNVCFSNNSIGPSTQANFFFNQTTPTNTYATKLNSRESHRKTTADQGYSNKFNLI